MVDEAVNHAIWARGIQKPPRKIRLVVTREEGFPIEVKLVEVNNIEIFDRHLSKSEQSDSVEYPDKFNDDFDPARHWLPSIPMWKTSVCRLDYRL